MSTSATVMVLIRLPAAKVILTVRGVPVELTVFSATVTGVDVPEALADAVPAVPLGAWDSS